MLHSYDTFKNGDSHPTNMFSSEIHKVLKDAQNKVTTNYEKIQSLAQNATHDNLVSMKYLLENSRTIFNETETTILDWISSENDNEFDQKDLVFSKLELHLQMIASQVSEANSIYINTEQNLKKDQNPQFSFWAFSNSMNNERTENISNVDMEMISQVNNDLNANLNHLALDQIDLMESKISSLEKKRTHEKFNTRSCSNNSNMLQYSLITPEVNSMANQSNSTYNVVNESQTNIEDVGLSFPNVKTFSNNHSYNNNNTQNPSSMASDYISCIFSNEIEGVKQSVKSRDSILPWNTKINNVSSFSQNSSFNELSSPRYKYAENTDDNEDEVSTLLINQCTESNTYLNGWYNEYTKDLHQNESMQSFLTRETFKGITLVKSQLMQAAQVFKDISNLVDEQQHHLDHLNNSVANTKTHIKSSLTELKKTDIKQQKSRKRFLFFIFVTCLVGSFIFLACYFQTQSKTNTKN